jgi:hypothetical protein
VGLKVVTPAQAGIQRLSNFQGPDKIFSLTDRHYTAAGV